jgi:hypothetical protein
VGDLGRGHAEDVDTGHVTQELVSLDTGSLLQVGRDLYPYTTTIIASTTQITTESKRSAIHLDHRQVSSSSSPLFPPLLLPPCDPSHPSTSLPFLGLFPSGLTYLSTLSSRTLKDSRDVGSLLGNIDGGEGNVLARLDAKKRLERERPGGDGGADGGTRGDGGRSKKSSREHGWIRTE